MTSSFWMQRNADGLSRCRNIRRWFAPLGDHQLTLTPSIRPALPANQQRTVENSLNNSSSPASSYCPPALHSCSILLASPASTARTLTGNTCLTSATAADDGVCQDVPADFIQSRLPAVYPDHGVAATQRRRLDASGLMPYFSGVFVSEESGYQKPLKEYFRLCLCTHPRL